MKSWFKLSSHILILGYAFLYIPIFTLIFFSFNSSKHVFLWEGFSVKWYVELFHNTSLLKAAWISLRVAISCATLSVILGLMSALVLVKFIKFKGKNLFEGLIKAPLMMPEVLMGLAFLLLFMGMEQLIGWPVTGSLTTITIAHTTLAVAYVTSIIYTQLSNFDQSLIEASMDLGVGPFKSFCLITFPIIAPSLLASWLLAFVLSLDDVIIASFVAGPQSTTLPIFIYSSIRYGLTPQVNALATIIIALVTTCILTAAFINKRDHKILTVKK